MRAAGRDQALSLAGRSPVEAPRPRLSRRDDGRYAYETKRGVALVLTAEKLVRRLPWLIPPRGLHLTNFHGVFASHSAARATVPLPTVEAVPARVLSFRDRRETCSEQAAPGGLGIAAAAHLRVRCLAVPLWGPSPGGGGGDQPAHRGRAAAEPGPVALHAAAPSRARASAARAGAGVLTSLTAAPGDRRRWAGPPAVSETRAVAAPRTSELALFSPSPHVATLPLTVGTFFEVPQLSARDAPTQGEWMFCRLLVSAAAAATLLACPTSTSGAPDGGRLSNPDGDPGTRISGTVGQSSSTVIVLGQVIDERTRAGLAGVGISAGTTSAVSDSNGRFSMTLASGLATLTAVAGGYLQRQQAIGVSGNTKEVVLELVAMGPKVTIGPAGGRIEHRGGRVEFPSGALAADTDVSFTRLGARGARTLSVAGNFIDAAGRAFFTVGAITVSPDLSLGVPARVLIPRRPGIRPERIRLLSRDSGGNPVAIRPRAVRGSWLEFEVPHFSDWAVSVDFSPTPPGVPTQGTGVSAVYYGTDPNEPVPVEPEPADPPAPDPQTDPEPDPSLTATAPSSTNIFPPNREDPRPPTAMVTGGNPQGFLPKADGTVQSTTVPVGTVLRDGDVLGNGSSKLETQTGAQVTVQNGPALMTITANGRDSTMVAVTDPGQAAQGVATALNDANIDEQTQEEAVQTAPRGILGLLVEGYGTIGDFFARLTVYALEKTVLYDYVKIKRAWAGLQDDIHTLRAAGMVLTDENTAFSLAASGCAADGGTATTEPLTLYRLSVTEGTAGIRLTGQAKQSVTAGTEFNGCSGTGCDPKKPMCACDATTCPGGCCGPSGICLPGDAPDACGRDGQLCVRCTLPTSACEFRACAPATCPNTLPVCSGGYPYGDLGYGITTCSDQVTRKIICDANDGVRFFCHCEGHTKQVSTTGIYCPSNQRGSIEADVTSMCEL
jgi:hypothetical protein